ncbi:MAG: hypothetical protein ACREHE_02790 [Rhizomicrobium sp.]
MGRGERLSRLPIARDGDTPTLTYNLVGHRQTAGRGQFEAHRKDANAVSDQNCRCLYLTSIRGGAICNECVR